MEWEQPPGILLQKTSKYLERARNRVEKYREAVEAAATALEEAQKTLADQDSSSRTPSKRPSARYACDQEGQPR